MEFLISAKNKVFQILPKNMLKTSFKNNLKIKKIEKFHNGKKCILMIELYTF